MSSAFVKFTAIRNLLRRRSLHITSTARTDAVRSEGATTGTKGFGDKEKAEEALWARKHDAELLNKLKQSLAEQKKSTDEIKRKIIELEEKHK
ncbi:hypothetical protein G6F46_006196 [Rhizopus delemar]|uniref:ATPase inhibitor, mitochondrial n=3 Tax=Rhizopus TaxID=4842 RepID=I1CNI6_RHIO9|nr:hypothetical protein RO3G_14727 [Rhizopus delemar RA 99-880]KAG1052816.1 hypothetical protein G6F43_005065 [Rhizopus delemar]KAG1544184.1 hypothetical protein G6F51_006223 [Rhizopus arrhizus]KAG1459682.1 hypothetical protein G6F55_004620 [Rhizopus delemar]KAG1500816.1 hypothetical protein G6F54_003464 [Rhizopus delemar]|eukprot:EIE90016.1 hypothetical protein RO3G_14727 [Rhizopus delemar RA 99-880]